jgi:hypothetical protein
MIKAKELRIGNWVLDMYDNKVKVTIIDDTVDWAKPIPLTPEILEKSGFVKQMEWTYCIEIQVGQKLVYYLGEKGWSTFPRAGRCTAVTSSSSAILSGIPGFQTRTRRSTTR